METAEARAAEAAHDKHYMRGICNVGSCWQDSLYTNCSMPRMVDRLNTRLHMALAVRTAAAVWAAMAALPAALVAMAA